MGVQGEYTPQVQNYKQVHEPASDLTGNSLGFEEMA
jgi:hypothetical protein